MMAEALQVDLGQRTYSVYVGRGMLHAAGSLISADFAGNRIAVVSDTNVAALYSARLLDSLRDSGFSASLEIVPAGESAKTLECYADLQRRLLSRRIGRDGMIVALGGGCVGDLAGFVAATLYRGVRLIHAPTTLLAQVDSSIGGKTGVNTAHGKNLVGAFHQPECVLADVDVLDTLPEVEQRAGYAEMFKAALLADRSFAGWLADHGGELLAGNHDACAYGIRQSIAIKAGIVSLDEREHGRRALLNLGHTFAHALEAEEGQTGALAHGYAVAVGLVLAAECSERMGLCPSGVAAEVRGHLQRRGLPVRAGNLAGAPFDPQALLARMEHDKKVRDGNPVLILLRNIGDAFVCAEPEWNVVESVLVDACDG